MKRFTIDAPTVAFDDEASGITTDADGDTQFDWQAVDTVTIDDVPHANAFEATEFYKLPATVARPIAQPYTADDNVIWLQKPWRELRDAAWSLDNVPWTLGHPDTGVVQDTADIRGFWSNPRAIDATHDLDADLHVPVSDVEAKQFIEDNGDVSVGFFNGVTDDYDTDVEPDTDVELDGYQTGLLFNHVASVQRGRCSSAQGCGLARANDQAPDSQPSGTVTNVTMPHTFAADAVGDWVSWDASGGTAYGKIVDTVTEGCTTRGKGDQEVCAEDDDPVAIVEVYDNESGESKDEEVRHKMSSLRDWSGPTSDSLKETDITDVSTDAPSGIYVTDDGMMFAVAPDEHPDDTTSHADDAKYPVNNCSDVVDAWNLRGQGDISISRDTLEARIKRVAEAKGCDMPETATEDNSDNITNMCDGCTDNSGIDMAFDDLTPEVALDKLAAEHDDIESYLTDLRQSADAADEAAEELDVDTDQLADTVAVHDERVSELEDEINDLRRPKMEEDAQFIAERTDRFGEDADAVLDTVDDVEDLETKRELVEDLTADTTETTANVDNSSDPEESDTSRDVVGGYVNSPWD